MNVHVFTVGKQQATKYVDCNIDPPMTFKNNPRRRLRCYDCGRVRWAKNLFVQVYYDCTRFTCSEGHHWYRNRCISNAPRRS